MVKYWPPGLNIQYANHVIQIDTVSLHADYTDNLQTINLTSPVADMTLKGEYTIQALPAAVKSIANQYLYTNSTDTAYTGSITANLQASVHIPDSMLFLIPGLKSISPFSVVSTINTDSAACLLLQILTRLSMAIMK